MRITSGEELKYRNGLAGLRGLGIVSYYPRLLTFQSSAFALTVPANRIRATLREQGTIPVIPGRRNRKRPIQYDERRYKDHWRVEAMFCRLKDFRRIATRYDKLARNFLSAVSLATAVAFWL